MITSLGEGVAENFNALISGKSGVSFTDDARITGTGLMVGAIPEAVYGSLRKRYDAENELTRAELLAVACLGSLGTGISGLPGRTGLAIASAKGNVELLEGRCPGDSPDIPEDELFGSMSSRIAALAGIPAEDVYVISDACVSGVAAEVFARRLILGGRYDNMAVVGVDVQNRFITSGFASFKSLSPELCRPYDASRCGLNLGEAAGALLLVRDAGTASALNRKIEGEGFRGLTGISGGAVTDDANHISGPSRTGDGLFLAMRGAMSEAGVTPDMTDALQMHGTATAYNDEMESKAVSLAGLQNVPVQSLKPCFGHTMGASGVIETIMAAEEMRSGIFAGTKGFGTPGVPMPMNVSAENRRINMKYCLKTASGFGGTNAAVMLTRIDDPESEPSAEIPAIPSGACPVRTVTIADGCISVDGSPAFSGEPEFSGFIRDAYRARGESYPKFYKMDDFCKLGYIASEWLLDGKNFDGEKCGIIICGKYGCLDTDIRHQRIIDKEGDASASPAVFVYTLPNVAAAEISIRHRIKGENIWLCSEGHSPEDFYGYASLLMATEGYECCICGRMDFINGEYFAKFDFLLRQ